jgi:hypothetical protein
MHESINYLFSPWYRYDFLSKSNSRLYFSWVCGLLKLSGKKSHNVCKKKKESKKSCMAYKVYSQGTFSKSRLVKNSIYVAGF